MSHFGADFHPRRTVNRRRRLDEQPLRLYDVGMAEPRQLHVVLSSGEDGWVVATCLAIPGCATQGRTPEEALENVREAIALCLEGRCEEGWELQVESSVDIALTPEEEQAIIDADAQVERGEWVSLDEVLAELRDRRGIDNSSMKAWFSTWGTDDEQDPPPSPE